MVCVEARDERRGSGGEWEKPWGGRIESDRRLYRFIYFLNFFFGEMCTQLQIAVSAVANTTGERECGALGVRSQREGWNGENDFASTTFYFFVSVECKKYFIEKKFPAHLLLSFHRLPVAGGVLRMIVANFA